MTMPTIAPTMAADELFFGGVGGSALAEALGCDAEVGAGTSVVCAGKTSVVCAGDASVVCAGAIKVV